MPKHQLPAPFDCLKYKKRLGEYIGDLPHRGKGIQVTVGCEADLDIFDALPTLQAVWKNRTKLFRVYRETVSNDQLFRINNFLVQTEPPLKELTQKQFEKLLSTPSTIEIEISNDKEIIRFCSYSDAFGEHGIQGWVNVEELSISDAETYCLY